MADSPEEIKKHLKTYTIVGAALLLLTVFTVWIAGIDLGSHTMNMVVGLAVACVKASLVAFIFMHLNHERPLIYKVLIFTIIFAIGLMVLSLLALFDPITTGGPIW